MRFDIVGRFKKNEHIFDIFPEHESFLKDPISFFQHVHVVRATVLVVGKS
jgi:hypothetical protein